MQSNSKDNDRFFAVLLSACIIFITYIFSFGVEYQSPNNYVRKLQFIEHSRVKKKDAHFGEESIILSGHFDQDVEINEEIFLFMYRMRIMVKINGEEIYRYGEKGDYPQIVKCIGADWTRIISKGIRKEDEIQITIVPVYKKDYPSSYHFFPEKMYVGNYHDFIIQQVRKNIVAFLASIGLFISSFIYMSGLFVAKIIQKKISYRYVCCSLVMLTGSISSFINYDYITLIFNNAFLVGMVNFLSYIMMCELLLIYLKCYLISENYIKITDTIIHLAGVIMIGYFVLQSMGMIDYLQILEFILPMEIGFVFIVCLFLLEDYEKYSVWEIKKVIISCVILGGCAIIEMIFYYCTDRYSSFVLLVGVSYFSISQLMNHMSHMREQMRKAKKAEGLEKELMQSQITIMLSQIQPHFLYNALTSIQELCLIDAKRAHEVIKRFSLYLRGNMDSLTTQSLIPFEKELQHIQNYLYIEKVRYGEYLEVEYKIEAQDFFIPALSIQPIVENAVKYGVGKKEEGGRVTIETYERPLEYIITIKDDGVGFNVKENEARNLENTKRNHVGIKNVKNRLSAQCNGNLTIVSEIGKGTEVTISIPKE